MTDESLKPLIAQMVAIINEAAQTALHHQAFIAALLGYLREQPSFDLARFSALLDQECDQLNIPKGPAPDRAEVLLDLLRDFEGPAH